jgi:hypothetical protein
MARRDAVTRRGPPQVTYPGPWRMSSHRGLRRAERTTWIHADNAGCGPGLAAGRRRRSAGRRGTSEVWGRRSGRAGGEPGADAATSCTPRRRWQGTRADAAAVPVRTGAGAAAPVEDRRRRTSRARRRSHAMMSLSRPRCGRNTTSDGRDLRWTGTTCRAASLDCPDGARREMPVGRAWNGLKAETHGGPGRAGPRTKLCRWRAY